MSKYTPGPWELLEHYADHKHDGFLIVSPRSARIAALWFDLFADRRQPDAEQRSRVAADAV